MKKLFFVLLFSISMPFLLASAQGITGSELFTLSISPESPTPRSEVRARVESFSTDLNRATISWSVNGKSVASGIGKTFITTTIGDIGSATTIRVSARTIEGRTLTQEVTIRPADVDLLWQTDSYVPALYPGKALSSSQSMLTIVAMPQIIQSGARIGAERVVYQWKRNGTPLPSQSGYGKRTLLVTGSKLFGQDKIEVTASTLDNKISAKKSVVIEVVEPRIVFYEDRPLEGPSYTGALSGRAALSSQELSLLSEPYYFSNNPSELSYTWTLNGRAISPSGENKNKLILRQETAGAGVAQVRLFIENTKRVLQSAEERLSVTFGNN